MRKLFSLLTCAALVVGLCMPAFARTGFYDIGTYTPTEREYSLMTDDAVLIYQKGIIDEYDWEDGVFAGSELFVPIGMWSDSGDDVIISDRQRKDDLVDVSYKAVTGGQFIEEISVVEGRKMKLEGLGGGMYARVKFTDYYPKLTGTRIVLRLVLSVNNVAYQTTRVNFECTLVNRVEKIDSNSVYGAKTPTQFKVFNSYNGEATFDFGAGVRYTGKVKAAQSLYLNLSREANASIAAMYPKTYMESYNFRGDYDGFSTVGKLEIAINKDKFKTKGNVHQMYAYEVVAGDLFAIDGTQAAYDSARKILTINTDSLGEYVLSAQPLMRTVDEHETDFFRSGYAVNKVGDTTVSQADEPKQGTSQPPVARQSTETQSEIPPAQTPLAQNMETEPVQPLEPIPAADNPNMNVNTGRMINATNNSSDNPDTSAGIGLMGMASLALLGAGAVLVTMRRKV